MSTVYERTLLLVKIKLKQQDMYTKAKRLGFTHPIVITCSQELDDLLNNYQGIQDMQY